ncbi:MAG: hypothetical protein PHU21_14150 [Elusimicrobia bacterium]|nr:hypothetical protein [Elusimicrobiota bacterium]
MSRRWRGSLEERFLILLAGLCAGAALLAFGWGLWEWGRMAAKGAGGERRLKAGTVAAYVGTAELDLQLARQAISRGDLGAGEARLNRAEDKLGAAQAVGFEGAQARAGLGDLLGRHATQLKSLRRRRAWGRLSSEGAEAR